MLTFKTSLLDDTYVCACAYGYVYVCMYECIYTYEHVTMSIDMYLYPHKEK